jgi:acrylyl-CoA reductase (NADPH)
MSDRFAAIVAEETAGRMSATCREISLAELPNEDVLVRVSHSTLNYKDGLAVTGRSKICRSFPMVCGIDLAGTVVESRHPAWQSGDRVLVNGYGLSERHWGGYSGYARVKGEWCVRIPAVFSPEQAMAIGTAGYTAMLCIHALEDRGVRPDSGPIVVTGASGGVGSVAVMLLARLGYEVIASTGRVAESRDFLTRLGARDLLDRAELARAPKPLEPERWAGAVDSVGGEVLATVIAQTRYDGTVTACGLAGGIGINTTVMPFILRGVTLAGIDSVMAPLTRRERAWARLAQLVPADLLGSIYRVEPMTAVPQLAEALLAGQVRGRIVIDVSR